MRAHQLKGNRSEQRDKIELHFSIGAADAAAWQLINK